MGSLCREQQRRFKLVRCSERLLPAEPMTPMPGVEADQEAHLNGVYRGRCPAGDAQRTGWICLDTESHARTRAGSEPNVMADRSADHTRNGEPASGPEK